MKNQLTFFRRSKKISLRTLFLLFICQLVPYLSHGSDMIYASQQMITLQVTERPILEVFELIEKNSEFIFLYYDKVIDPGIKVTVNIDEKTITETLDQVFKHTDLTYTINNRQISISKKAAPPVHGPALPQQDQKVTGIVMDNMDDTLAGVTILIEGSTRGVTTDLDGTFSIDVKPTDKLRFTYLGYQEQVIAVGNQKHIVVRMEPKLDELSEVVVVAFGTQKKESVIGSISTVKVDDLKMPGGKLSTSLAGQMAGIIAVQRSGEPGSGADFWIRGMSTFGDYKQPLVLIDGMERSLDLVDPEDIETFAVLKDATATALYGVRGANGIIVITIKRGKEGKPVVQAKVETGFLAPVRLPKLANGEQWIDYFNDINFYERGVRPISPEEKAKYLNGSDPDLYPNVDWMKEIYKDYTTNQRASINVSGGGTNVRYYVSGLYYTENGMFDPDESIKKQYDPSMRYKKYAFRTNLELDITKSTTLTLNLGNQYETKNRLGIKMEEMYQHVIYTTPISTPLVYSDGTLAISMLDRGINPYNLLNHRGYTRDFYNNMQSLVSLTQDFSGIITPGLKANVKFSWDAANGSTIEKLKDPNTFYATGRDEEGNLIFRPVREEGSDYLVLNKSNWGNRTINFESSLTYERIFNQTHRVGGLFLFNLREYTDNFPNDYIASFANKNMGIAGRVTYSFKDRYFIEGNFGYNGSENFAPGKRFGFFPAVAVGYLVSNEEFFKKAIPFMDLLKIKGSYGEIGNDKIGGDRRFAYNTEMTYPNRFYHFGQTGQTWIGAIATGHPGNPSVSWETAKKTNIGVELGFLHKLKIQVDYFSEKREGIYIQQQSVPSVVGNNIQQYVNIGSMENRGIDLTMEYLHRIQEVTISARGSFTFARNKRIYDDRPTPVWPYQEWAGQRTGQLRGLVALGLFESEEDIVNSPTQLFGPVLPGDIKYKDINGDGVIDSNDEVAIGHPDIPEISYGFGSNITWKGFDFSFFFQGVGNTSRMINGVNVRGGTWSNYMTYGNIFADTADKRWRPENPDPNAEYPRMHYNLSENNNRDSSFWLRNMAFLRLKNVGFGYTFPKEISRKAGMSNLRVFVEGVNLLTFSPFKLWDPELDTQYGGVYPQMKTASMGLNITF
ncbi:MAG: TonB-dependent receptor [Tannerellaceae bacterium]|nr:TonB-dependent receptor [Tannerellaceae bacterium]